MFLVLERPLGSQVEIYTDRGTGGAAFDQVPQQKVRLLERPVLKEGIGVVPEIVEAEALGANEVESVGLEDIAPQDAVWDAVRFAVREDTSRVLGDDVEQRQPRTLPAR